MNRRKRRGAVLVEYAFLLTVFAIPVMFGIFLGGLQLFRDYMTIKGEVLRPWP
jgi:hypothetical protein